MTASRLKSFTYTTSLRWTQGVEGLLSASGKPDISVSSPPEFRGPAGNWTPENLYIASIETCLMLTYLLLCRTKQIELASYESSAEGLLEPVSGVQVVSKVTVRIKAVVKSSAHLTLAKELADVIHEKCFISNSIESEVIVEHDITAAT